MRRMLNCSFAVYNRPWCVIAVPKQRRTDNFAIAVAHEKNVVVVAAQKWRLLTKADAEARLMRFPQMAVVCDCDVEVMRDKISRCNELGSVSF